MRDFDRCLDMGSKEIRQGGIFGKKVTVSLYVYESCITGEAFIIYDQTSNIIKYDIAYERIKNISIGMYERERCIFVDYKKEESLFSPNDTARLAIIGLDNLDKLAETMRTAYNSRMQAVNYEKEKSSLAAKKRNEEAMQKEKDAKDFYKNCYEFHIKPDTPIYTFFSGENMLVGMYIDNDRSLNFLRIDGYRGEELVGNIPFNKIHYYEKAGNVTYTTDIHGTYSSFGGSMTGGRYSKWAAALGGALFGFMGMSAGALFSYKPTEQERGETSFKLDSEIVKIDDRNIILNFYSDEKKQFVDIELPQDVYNFLQTYLPEKKYHVVEELERKTALHQSKEVLKTGELLYAPGTQMISESKSEQDVDVLQEFKLKVDKLKVMREAGLLSDDEFDEERKKLLSQI